MKNENKCFFSISLENGIIITGENPLMVKTFLTDLSLICYDAIKKDDPIRWKNHVKELRKNFIEAWETIYENLKNKKENKK